MSNDASAALQAIVDMFHRDFHGPAPEELREAISTADLGLNCLDRKSDAWNPTTIEFTDQDVQDSLKELCELLSGPIMGGAPEHILDIIENGRAHIGPVPDPFLDDGEKLRAPDEGPRPD